ncbi:MAG: glycosyltransferase [Candidatus Omnitrophica bacterium]|nr:glycosyltransferase [Candidatus Omnitrophota bacterium]
MKILTIAPEPFFEHRGTPLSIYYRVLTMSEMGHQVDVLAYPLGRDIAVKGVRVYRTLPIPFLRSIRIGPSLTKLFLDFFLFVSGLRLLALRRYEMIHVNEEAAYFAVLYKKLFGVKVLYDMHSHLSQQLKNFNFSKNRLLIRIFDALDRQAVRHADAVLTICPDLNKVVASLDPARKFFLVENSLLSPVRLAKKEGANPAVSVDEGALGDRKVVLYAGTFEHYQGLPLLLASAALVIKEHPGVVFVLAGGKPAQVEALRRESVSRGLKDRVFFTGIVSQDAVARLVERAQVLVSPRITGTNTPLKIYSYLHAGGAIVATDLHTHRQVLNEEIAVLTAPSPRAFADGIIRALTEPGLGRQLGARARAYYEERYGEKRYKQKLSEALSCAASAGI